MPSLRILNLKHIAAKAQKLEDPRWIFYSAILESSTVENYMAMVGDIVVLPPTFPETMGADRELQYMARRHYVEIGQDFDMPDNFASVDEAAAKFVPDPTLDARRRTMRSVFARQGQSKFRETLLTIYDRRCAITGCGVEQVLEAAHVTPYLGSHTNDIRNGILLRSDLHALWDQGLLAIVPERNEVWLHTSIVQLDEEYRQLNGRTARQPNPNSSAPSIEALTAQWEFAYRI